jgi:hypothetical protein
MIKMSDTRQSLADQEMTEDSAGTVLLFEVCRGRTRYPHRPVKTEKFLIGQAPGCDLRLGGDDMPALHSVVHREEGRFRLESIADAPPLMINGEVQTSAIIHSGDQIQIGSIEFTARFLTTRVDADDLTDEAEATTPDIPNLSEDDSCLEDLTAEELVDLIDREQQAVAEFESRQQAAEHALLDSVMQRVQEQPEIPQTVHQAEDTIPTPSFLQRALAMGENSTDSLLDDLGRTAEQLSQFVTELRKRFDEQSGHTETETSGNVGERLQSLLKRISDKEPRSAA